MRQVGAIVGALHGVGDDERGSVEEDNQRDWCEDWVAGLENGPHGRDYIMALASDLAELDIRE